jgi:hypothetical protein
MMTIDRKRQLIAEGRVHRAEILLARESIQQAIRPEVLTRHIADELATKGMSYLRHKFGLSTKGELIQSLLPLAAGLLSNLPKYKSSLRPFLQGTAAAGASALAVSCILRLVQRRSATHGAHTDSAD